VVLNLWLARMALIRYEWYISILEVLEACNEFLGRLPWQFILASNHVVQVHMHICLPTTPFDV